MKKVIVIMLLLVGIMPLEGATDPPEATLTLTLDTDTTTESFEV